MIMCTNNMKLFELQAQLILNPLNYLEVKMPLQSYLQQILNRIELTPILFIQTYLLFELMELLKNKNQINSLIPCYIQYLTDRIKYCKLNSIMFDYKYYCYEYRQQPTQCKTDDPSKYPCLQRAFTCLRNIIFNLIICSFLTFLKQIEFSFLFFVFVSHSQFNLQQLSQKNKEKQIIILSSRLMIKIDKSMLIFTSNFNLIINKQLTKMKGSKMHTPVVTEIYHQKVLYQSHLKKLQKIRQERKNQLAFDATRLTKHQQIKTSKSRSFAHKYNQQHHQIAQQNVKFFNKLEKVRPFTRYSSFSTHQRQEIPERTTMTPFKKRRIAQTQKQNSRIFVKVKSVSSNLSKDKFLKDYAKSQQIRTRIARYATQNNKVCLKSEKFINFSNDKGNLTSHYNHNDILKNKVENPINSFNYKQRRGTQTERRQEQTQIFATQPVRLRNRSKKYQL